jgi:hypothetical protein
MEWDVEVVIDLLSITCSSTALALCSTGSWPARNTITQLDNANTSVCISEKGSRTRALSKQQSPSQAVGEFDLTYLQAVNTFMLALIKLKIWVDSSVRAL